MDSTKGKSEDRYHGFSLRSVMWGYRDIFEEAIEELFQQGCLGPQRQEVTDQFFDLLKRADQSCFDSVLRQFLGALRPANRWIMDLPGIFTDLVELGAALAGSKLYYGIRFFETLATGGYGLLATGGAALSDLVATSAGYRRRLGDGISCRV